MWTDQPQTLKWANDVADAVPVESSGGEPTKLTKNQEAVKQLAQQMNGDDSGDLSMDPKVYEVLARFGEFIHTTGYKKEDLFQAMDCEQVELLYFIH